MKTAIFQLLDKSTILVKTKNSFEVKCSHAHFSFLHKNKNFCKVNRLLDNHYFQDYANYSIFPFLGAKLISQQKVKKKKKEIKTIPYFSLSQLITL